MFKKLFIFITIGFSMLLCSCMSTKDIDLSVIEKKIDNAISAETYTKGSSKELRRFFGINTDDILDYTLYTPAYTMDVNEILIVKVKDQANIDIIKDSIDARVESQISTFGSYGPDQCALLEDYILKSKGNYIFYCVSPENEKVYKLFKESLK
ncbi:MAG: DUF4358 domain-containing protein [Sarcina sp.]